MTSGIALMLTIDVPLLVPDNLTLDQYLGKGLQPNEEAMPDESATFAPIEPTFDQAALSQLTMMGFPEIRCKKALLAVPGDVEGAMNWLFQHMEDPDIDAPLLSSKGPAPEPDQGLVAMLQDMGFSPAQAKKALRETVRTAFNFRSEVTESQPRTAMPTGPSNGYSITLTILGKTPYLRLVIPLHLHRPTTEDRPTYRRSTGLKPSSPTRVLAFIRGITSPISDTMERTAKNGCSLMTRKWSRQIWRASISSESWRIYMSSSGFERVWVSVLVHKQNTKSDLK